MKVWDNFQPIKIQGNKEGVTHSLIRNQTLLKMSKFIIMALECNKIKSNLDMKIYIRTIFHKIKFNISIIKVKSLRILRNNLERDSTETIIKSLSSFLKLKKRSNQQIQITKRVASTLQNSFKIKKEDSWRITTLYTMMTSLKHYLTPTKENSRKR